MADENNALLERIEKLEAALADMQQRAEGAEAALEDERETHAEAMAAIEDERTRTELAAAGIVDGVEDLVALKRINASLFASMVQMAQRPSGVQEPIGKVGVQSVSGEPTAADVIEMAEAQGFTYGKGLIRWVAKNYPQLVDEVQAAARD